MARKHREDRPGEYLHVWNRGIAQRATFEAEAEFRYFLSRLARCVRWGIVEVLAYVLMTNHYHFLLRSLLGEVSRAMARIQGPYTQRFNRRRDRDGALFRGRYMARPVRSLADRWIVFRYIHDNPVAAGLAMSPEAYAYSSAFHFAAARRPPWLCPDLHDELAAMRGSSRIVRTSFEGSPGASGMLTPGQVRLVETRMTSPTSEEEDALDLLLQRDEPRTRAWFAERARMADQTEPGPPYADSMTIQTVVAAARRERPEWTCRPESQRRRPAAAVAAVGLLRDLGGLTYSQIAAMIGCSVTQVRNRYMAHVGSIMGDHDYARDFLDLTHRCLDACHGGLVV